MVIKIERDHSIFRFIFPWQSMEQCHGYLLIIVPLMIVYVLVMQQSSLSSAQLLALPFALSMVSLYLCLPARMSISPQSMANRQALQRELRKLRYEHHSANDGQRIYRRPNPKIFTWKENDIAVREREQAIVVVGPKLVLRALRKRLLRQNDA